MTFEVDKEKSIKASKIVIPLLFPDCKIINIENFNEKTAFLLDISAGIDIYLEDKNGQLISIASRNQFMNEKEQPYNSFTIRYKRISGIKTEFEKRNKAINNGVTYPNYTIQGYLTNDFKILSCAKIATKQLYEYYENNKNFLKDYIANEEGNKFKVIWWNKLEYLDTFEKWTPKIRAEKDQLKLF